MDQREQPGGTARNADLRRALRARRRALTEEVQREAAERVARRIEALGLVQPKTRLAATLPDADGELSPLPIVAQCLASGGQTCFPVVEDDQLLFRFASPDPHAADLEIGPFGLRQPKASCPAASLADLDAVLVPLVAFDNAGNRVGRGRGFYDRALAQVAIGAPGTPGRPWLVGLAHDLQQVPELTPTAHDVALDLIITPGGVWGPHRASVTA